MTPLYSIDILRLAAATAETPRLANAQATVEHRSAVCGSRIVVDVETDSDGRVARYGHDVRACALGQAAATLLARNIVGHNAQQIAAARDVLGAYLAGEHAQLPDWDGLDILERARPYPARHPSIRLAFEAAADAVAQAAGATIA